MGYALAQAALDRGAAVTSATGPTDLSPPHGATVVRVGSAMQMLDATRDAVVGADALLMAAAVADFRPATAGEQKIKKQPGQTTLTLELARNPDIVAGIDQPGLLKVGFAAETEDLLANARTKLNAKGLAMIVANDAVATIGSLDSTATLIFRDRPAEPLPTMSKEALAEIICERLVALLGVRATTDD
jgi:phosphopantothenoylcysteine decarboxylase/phosphopantothenate--cysteine ligase